MQKPPSFKINTDLIRGAGNGGQQRIQTSGAYVGTITKAKHVISRHKQTHGIEFAFESPQGKADFMTLWVMQANGSVIEGFQGIADSIAACMKQREYSPQQASITEYNFETRQEEQTQAWIYPALMNKPVGLVLQAEEYRKGNGDIATRMNIVAAFDAQTRQTAVEILDGAQPEMLDRIVASLKDKKLKESDVQAGYAGYGSYSSNQQANGADSSSFEDFQDDDIPF